MQATIVKDVLSPRHCSRVYYVIIIRRKLTSKMVSVLWLGVLQTVTHAHSMDTNTTALIITALFDTNGAVEFDAHVSGPGEFRCKP